MSLIDDLRERRDRAEKRAIHHQDRLTEAWREVAECEIAIAALAGGAEPVRAVGAVGAEQDWQPFSGAAIVEATTDDDSAQIGPPELEGKTITLTAPVLQAFGEKWKAEAASPAPHDATLTAAAPMVVDDIPIAEAQPDTPVAEEPDDEIAEQISEHFNANQPQVLSEPIAPTDPDASFWARSLERERAQREREREREREKAHGLMAKLFSGRKLGDA